MGASYGTAKSGVGIASMGVLKPELIFKSIVPVIMAGILGIYGLIISLLIFQKVRKRLSVSGLTIHRSTPQPTRSSKATSTWPQDCAVDYHHW